MKPRPSLIEQMFLKTSPRLHSLGLLSGCRDRDSRDNTTQCGRNCDKGSQRLMEVFINTSTSPGSQTLPSDRSLLIHSMNPSANISRALCAEFSAKN